MTEDDKAAGTSGIGAPVEGSAALNALATLASHAWRLSRLSRQACERLPPHEGARLANQIRYIDRQIEDELAKAGLRLVDLEGQAYDPGIAATALNAADFAPTDELRIEQMIEPVILSEDGLLKFGAVLLGKATT